MIKTLCDRVCLAVNQQFEQKGGMDLSPSDVAHIISLFIEGMVNWGPPHPNDETLRQMIDELNKIRRVMTTCTEPQ